MKFKLFSCLYNSALSNALKQNKCETINFKQFSGYQTGPKTTETNVCHHNVGGSKSIMLSYFSLGVSIRLFDLNQTEKADQFGF